MISGVGKIEKFLTLVILLAGTITWFWHTW